jgi:hypothetical protein
MRHPETINGNVQDLSKRIRRKDKGNANFHWKDKGNVNFRIRRKDKGNANFRIRRKDKGNINFYFKNLTLPLGSI